MRSPTGIINSRSQLRRAVSTGDPGLVLDAVERVLSDSPSVALYDEAVSSFYNVFWFALEDEALCEQAGVLDLRIGREAEKRA